VEEAPQRGVRENINILFIHSPHYLHMDPRATRGELCHVGTGFLSWTQLSSQALL
jgi:hypothetical protein